MGDARRVLEGALDGFVTPEMADKLFNEVLAFKKRGWAVCKKCGSSTMEAEIPDAKAVVSALNDLLTQAKGRPGQAEGEGSGAVTFVNWVVLVSDEP